MKISGCFAILILVLGPSAVAQRAQDIAFVHRASAANTAGNSTYIDHQLTNSSPSALLLITQNYTPWGTAAALNNHHTGVWFDGSRRQWAIFNQDQAAMPAGAAFNVVVLDGASAAAGWHSARAENIAANSTFFNRPQTAGNPAALLLVTPNYNPSGAGGVYDNHAIGVWYGTTRGQWAVFHQDMAPMAEQTAFNFKAYAAEEPAFVHRATAGNRIFHTTLIDDPRTNDNPNALLFVTQSYNPGGTGGTYNDRKTGVMYAREQRKWAIFNQDSAPIPEGAAFHVAVYGASAAPADTAQSGDLRVTGMEVVQSVQVYPGNSIPLIGYKRTAVRVYVASEEGYIRGPWTGVEARLTVHNRSGSHSGRPIPDRFLRPVNGSYGVITVSPGGSNRDTLDDSFLFLLDMDQTAPGVRDLQVEVSSSSGRSEADRENNRWSYTATFGPSLTMTMIGGRYANAQPFLPASPFGAYEMHRRYVENTYPISQFWIVPLPGDPAPAMTNDNGSITIGGRRFVIQYGTNITDSDRISVGSAACFSATMDGAGQLINPTAVVASGTPGAICGDVSSYSAPVPNYINGHNWITRMIDGLYPRGAVRGYSLQPEGSCFCGWCCNGSNGNRVGRGHNEREGSTMAHELGHSWGMGHIQSPPDHTNDGPHEDYPHAHAAMGPQRGIRIGPGGVSVVAPVSGDVHMHDFMTYGFPNWISPFTYCKLMSWISNGTLNCPASATRAEARRDEIHLAKFPPSLLAQTKSSLQKEGVSLYIAGQINADGSANLSPFEMMTAAGDQSSGKEFSVALESSAGEVLVQRTFELRSHDTRPGEPSPFSLIVPWNAHTDRILLRRGGTILAAREVSASDPQVMMSERKEGALSGKQTVSWSASDPDGDELTFSVHYSIDSGNRWVPLGVLLKTTDYLVDFDSLAGSDSAMLRVLASDGVRTTEARSSTFSVERKAPQLSVDPADGSTVSTDDVVLEARAFDWEDGSITNPESYRWTSDRDGELSIGQWLVLRNARLSPGVHTITVTATDQDQQATSATFQVNVPALSLTHVK